tara:strand:- start:1205 stop:3409 length:2205 start_codon:yes stop_codon:yes gene_type:complete
MAYGLKYEDDFFDVDEHKWKLKIYQWNFSGTKETNSLTLGPDAVQIMYEQKGDDFFSPIIGSSCKISMYVTESLGGTFWEDEDRNWEAANFNWEENNFEFLFPIDDREYKIEVCYASAYTGGEYVYSTYWKGFLIQDQFSMPLKPFPYLIQMYASDLVGTLNGYNYADTTARPTVLQAIVGCMKNINEQNASGTAQALELQYQSLCRIYPSTSVSAGDPLTQTYINSNDAMKDENDNFINCKVILESLLQMFNCRMFQARGYWIIVSNDAMSLTSFNTSTAASRTEFINYLKTGADGTDHLSIASPTKTINSTGNNDTIQPIGNNLVRITKRPCVSNRTTIDIKDFYVSEFDDSDYEESTTRTGTTPSWGHDFGSDWSENDQAKQYAVTSTSIDTSGTPVAYFPVDGTVSNNAQMYQGTYCALLIGNSSTSTTAKLTNATGVFDNVTAGTKCNFSFAYQLQDPAQTSPTAAIAFTIRYRLKIGSLYFNATTGNFTPTATINSFTGGGQRRWELYEKEFTAPATSSSPTITIEFFDPAESTSAGTDFRLYIDVVSLKIDKDVEFYSTKTNIIKADYKDNSGVIDTFENRYGQVGNNAYSNALTGSDGTAIVSYKHFSLFSAASMNLEAMMHTLRLNDLAASNNRYEGTFRKVNTTAINPSGTRVNSITPIDMLTLPKLGFTSVSGLTDQLAIDRLDFNIAKNRIKLVTHTPSQTALDSTSDVQTGEGFFEKEPED